MAILRVKNAAGEWEEIPAIVGPAGPRGEQGADGEAGADGYTPVKGTDYWTETDKQEIVSAVLANFTDVSEVGQ